MAPLGEKEGEGGGGGGGGGDAALWDHYVTGGCRHFPEV